MLQGRSSRWEGGPQLLAAVLWGGANLLFIRYVGQWLIVTGAVGLALSVAAIITTFLHLHRASEFCCNLLLALTLVNFNAWAFSHLANLMFYLGLFFFLLFALIEGAAVFRLLAMFRPLNRMVLVACGLIFVAMPWAGALVLEASYLPEDVYDVSVDPAGANRDRALDRRITRLPPGMTSVQLKEHVVQSARGQLSGDGASSLTLSYIRWALTDGTLELPIAGRDQPLRYERGQRTIGFGIRLLLSLLLSGYGVGSLIRWLDHTEEAAVAAKIARAEAKENARQTSAAAAH